MKSKKGLFADADIFVRIVLLITVMLASTVFFSVFWYVLTDADIENINSLKVLQLLQSVGMFVIPPFILAFLWSRTPVKSLHFYIKPTFRHVIITIVLMLLAVPAINLLTWFNQHIVLPDFFHNIENWLISTEESAAELTEKLVNVDNISGLLVNIFLISVIPAFGEELFFRGSVFSIIESWKGKLVAVWLAAIVFSAVHFQFYGFIPRMFLGALFGYLLIWSKSMWLPILAHFVNNYIAVQFYYLKYNDYDVPDIDLIGTEKTWWIGLLSLLATLGCILYLQKSLKKTKDLISSVN